MNQEEAIKLFMIIKAQYPNHYKDFDKATIKFAAEMWHKLFSDYTFEVVFRGFQKYTSENKFPPTIADIREIVVRMMNPQALKSGEEAWEEVITAVRKFGFYQQSAAFETFDEATKRAVRTIGWQDICKSEKIGIERANFFKCYDSMKKETREQAMLPRHIFEQIEELKKKAADEGEDGPNGLRLLP